MCVYTPAVPAALQGVAQGHVKLPHSTNITELYISSCFCYITGRYDREYLLDVVFYVYTHFKAYRHNLALLAMLQLSKI